MKKAAQATPNRQLRQERELHCWSQLEVANRIGTSSLNVSRWERGITFPTAHFRQELCTLFGKNAVELGLLQVQDETTSSHESLPFPTPQTPHPSSPDQNAVASPLQTAHIAEERRLVTLLFADVTEARTLDEPLDPEDVRTLISRYYTHTRQIIESHGGTLEQVIGNAVMAVFGLPHAHSDDAERALAAALRLRETMTIDMVPGRSLLLRIGIDTGEVITTDNPTSCDFLVTGDAVNVAAQLQQATGFGEILVSERTATATQAAFLFYETRLVEVKGKRHPLHVFPLKQARTLRQVERPPLVGRQPDLHQLELLRERTLSERQPHVVSIIAPAGTGKTRLLEEFLAHCDPAAGFRIAVARCPSYGQTLTYWPLRGLLTGLLGDTIGKPQIMDVFVQGGQTPADAARLADFVLTTLGVEHEEVADRESIFAAWRLLLEAFARQAPCVVVFEDLHWASESLLDLVEYLMPLHMQAALLMIVLSRPELLDRRPAWGGGQQNFTAMALQPLSEAQTRKLVEQEAAGLHQALRERIVAHSGGNPFFALELIRGITEKSATVSILPDTVHAAVLARLDLLSPLERAVTQAASVAGRVFRIAVLQTVLENLTLHEIHKALDSLMTRQLIEQVSGEAFTFHHVLIHDVAYGTLSRSERIRMHSKIALWFEQSATAGPEEFTEAHTYQQSAIEIATEPDGLLIR